MAYKNGYRTYESCSYAVNPIRESLEDVTDFSCSLYFQQQEHPEHFIYVNPGISLTRPQVKDTKKLKVLPNFPTAVTCAHARSESCFPRMIPWRLL